MRQHDRIILAGGTGFLGQVLARFFAERDCAVVVLTRRSATRNGPVLSVQWDGRKPGEWAQQLDGAEVLINLAGRSTRQSRPVPAKSRCVRRRCSALARTASFPRCAGSRGNDLILKSRRVMPGRLAATGFEFQFRALREALADLCR